MKKHRLQQHPHPSLRTKYAYCLDCSEVFRIPDKTSLDVFIETLEACPKAPNNTQVRDRNTVELSIINQRDLGKVTQPNEQIQATLDLCFGGCKYFDIELQVCTRYGDGCKMYPMWLKILCTGVCDELRRNTE